MKEDCIDAIYSKIVESADFLRKHMDSNYECALILGSGLTDVLEIAEIHSEIPFGSIPYLSNTTFHKGNFVFCTISETPVIILTGRLHYYEGYSTKEVTYPIRILQLLGIRSILLTNAAGGLNEHYNAGDIVNVRDHINLLPDHPLRGMNDDRLGIRFPDMLNCYTSSLRKKMKDIFTSLNYDYREGVYVCFQGPTLETPAEYRYLKNIGADLTGMSTVPEVIVARHAGMEIALLSIVTNQCYPIENIRSTTVATVLEIARQSTIKLKEIITLYYLEKQ